MTTPRSTPDVRFRAGSPTVVISHDQRTAWGLRHWVDGTMGLLRDGPVTTVLSPDGPRTVRLDIAGDDWAAASVQEVELHGRRERSDHASGGPVLLDPASGRLMMTYHGERFTDGDPTDYWSFIGLATSDDGGRSFVDLGPIVTPEQAEDADDRGRSVELGPGSFVVHDGWLMVYFLERSSRGVRHCLAVARCGLDDVLAAAAERRPPVFRKHRDGRWDEPALGGTASELMPIPWLVWFDVATVAPLDRHVVVFSVSWLAGRAPQWMYYASTSSDGLHWSPPQPVLDAPVGDEIIYLTIDSGGPQQRVVEGDRFFLYRTRSTTSYRWDDAWLERLEVRYEVGPT